MMPTLAHILFDFATLKREVDGGWPFGRWAVDGLSTVAIVDGKRRLGFASWYEEIARVAGGLIALGIGRA